MESVLVTGGAGYIGSHVCKLLAESGFNPIAYDNLVSGQASSVNWGPFERGDVLDRDRLNDVIKFYKPSSVMHLASYLNVRESSINPVKYYRNNVQGSLTLLEAMRDHSIRTIVYSSSAAVYGVPDVPMVTENSPLQPISPYGSTKLTVENLLGEFEVAHDFEWVSLRYFNAAGSDKEQKAGKDHRRSFHLIPQAMMAAIGQNERFVLFGADHETADGTCIRDFVHVSDIAKAHINALLYLNKNHSSGAYNLGNGNGYSVREVLNMIEIVSGKKIPVTTEAMRAGDPAILISDSTKAKRVLDWRPEISNLRSIIETDWEWLCHPRSQIQVNSRNQGCT